MEKWGGTSLTPREGGRKGRKEGSLGGSFLDCHAIKESASRTSPSPQAKVSQSVQFSRPVSPVQLLSCVRLFATPWTAACQASLSITNSWRPPKPMYIELVMPSNHLIFCRPLLLPPSIFPSIRIFSSELVHCIRWPKYWSFSFSIIPSNEYSGLISLGWADWISLQSKGLSKVFSNTTVQKH